LFKKARLLQIDGPNVAAWARFLVIVSGCSIFSLQLALIFYWYCDWQERNKLRVAKGETMLPDPDSNVLREYEDLGVGNVPQSIQDATVIARSDDDLEVLSRAFTGVRQGYANNHQIPDAESLLRAANDWQRASDDIGKHRLYS
jgi:hypothetical protein